jgi:hypothetical protein
MRKFPTWLLPIILLALCLGQPGAAHAEDPSDDPTDPQLIPCKPNQTPITLLDNDALFPTRMAAYEGNLKGRRGPNLIMPDPTNNVIYMISLVEDPIQVEILAGVTGRGWARGR